MWCVRCSGRSLYASSLISVSIILASGLSFLGLGVKPPEPEGA
jgi:peptide/nickel transport system permease protein